MAFNRQQIAGARYVTGRYVQWNIVTIFVRLGQAKIR